MIKTIHPTIFIAAALMLFAPLSSANALNNRNTDSIHRLVANSVMMKINIPLSGSCSANFQINDGDYVDVDTKGTQLEVKEGDKLNMFVSTNDGYTLDGIYINGKKETSEAFVFDLSLDPFIKEGKVDIEIKCTSENGGGTTTNQSQTFVPNWGRTISVKSKGENPLIFGSADDAGNVYECFVVKGDKVAISNSETQSSITKSVLLVKYDNQHEVVWKRSLKNDISLDVRALTINNNRIYVLGRYSNESSNLYNFTAEKGANGIAKNTFPCSKKEGITDDDMYLATYDLDGNLKGLKSISSNKICIEEPQKMLVNDGHIYIIGGAQGDHPSYDGKEVKTTIEEFGAYNFGFIFDIDAQSLAINKIYSVSASDELHFSGIASVQGKTVVVGTTSAESIQLPGEAEESLTANPTTLLLELNASAENFSQKQIIESIYVYDLIASPKGKLYISGSANGNFVQTNDQSVTVNGAYIAQWNLGDAHPEMMRPIGTNNEDNVVKSMSIFNDTLYFGGEYNGEFNPTSTVATDKGGGDTFVGAMLLDNQNITKLLTFGSSGTDIFHQLNVNPISKKLVINGAYNLGENWSLENVVAGNPEASTAVYFAVFNLGDVTNGITPITTSTQILKLTQNGVTWLQSGDYAVYNLSGVRQESGYAVAGQTLHLLPGVYVVRMNGNSQKVMIKK